MLVGTKEIADRLTELGWEVLPTGVRKWVERSHKGELATPFPEPVYVGPGGRAVWQWKDVEKWARRMGKIK